MALLFEGPYRGAMTFLAGLGIGLSLIIAIGAQNVFVLRQGLRREHVLAVVIICAASDAVLIAVGVAGLGFLVQQAPWLIVIARWAGAIFLITYGALAARRAWHGGGAALVVDDRPADAGRTGTPASATATLTRRRLLPVAATAIALTWLNPHVYLDTVLMLGSVAATHGDQRWVFAAGAVLASVVWFTGLGFGARHLGSWLRTPRAWRILDAGIAVVMIVLGVNLVLPVLGG